MNSVINSVLLIDDDEPTNFINTLLMEETGYVGNISIAENGLKALGYLKQALAHEGEASGFFVPQLIFLDVNMPRMNGWEFLAEYKNIKSSLLEDTIIIIMLTTSFNPEDKIRAGNIAEVAAIENKPLTSEMIERVISTHFPRRSGSNEEKSQRELAV